MKQLSIIKKNFTQNSSKLVKLQFLLENSKKINTKNLVMDIDNSFSEESKDLSKNLSLYLSLVEKPVNLLFSIDQFLFEFSKKTYQQKKSGEFFQQLKERKKLSLFYGHLTRKQIINLFDKVKKNKGYFSKNIFSLLERRLDVVIYRSGLTKTIVEARQLIKHKKILVNSNSLNVPSYSLNPGDVISFKPQIVEKLTHQLRNSTNARQVNQRLHPKIFGDFYSKLKKNLSNEKSIQYHTKLNDDLKFTVLEKPKLENQLDLNLLQENKNFKSKLLCKLLIQLLCTKIKLRSFSNLKKDIINLKTNKLAQEIQLSQKKVYTLLKWKISLNLDLKNNLFFKFKKQSKTKDDSQQVFSFSGGCLQKKPLFWEHSLINLKHKNLTHDISELQIQRQKKEKQNIKSLNFQKNVTLYRNSFLLFLKQLENSQKFSGLTALNVKKYLFKKSFTRKISGFWEIMNFRIIKPIHLEMSYNTLNIIFLYSPQRLNFPFYIDLDLIKRSLR